MPMPVLYAGLVLAIAGMAEKAGGGKKKAKSK